MKEFYKQFQNSWVQTFDDTKQGKPFIRSFHMSELKDKWKDIVALNEKGAGVFFTSNPCKGGRTAENVTSIEWVFVDLDDGSKASQMEIIKQSPLPPTMIVESKNGYHVYWKCNCTKKQFDFIIKGLIDFFGADPACKDTCRVLRLPPFNHIKDLKAPYPIKIYSTDFSLSYTPDEMINNYTMKYDYSQTDLEIIKQIPIKEILREFNVEMKGNFIYENGEQTSASINVGKNYINRFSGKEGSGSSIDAVMIYGNKSKSEAIKWLKDFAGIEDKRIELGFKKQVIVDEIDVKGKVFTWGTNESDRKISPIQEHHFNIFSGETGSGKTAYTFFMACENAKLGNKVLFISLEMGTEEIYTRAARQHACITKYQWRDKSFTDNQRQIYMDKKKQLKDLDNLTMYGMPKEIPSTMENIEKIIKQAKPDLVFLDNFDLVMASEGTKLEKEEIIAKTLMDLSTQSKTPIIVLHHFNKGNDQNFGKIRTINSLKGSSKIGHNCDIAVTGVRHPDPQSDKERAMFTLIQQKDRDFGTGGILTTYFNKGEFTDVEPLGDAYDQAKTTFN